MKTFTTPEIKNIELASEEFICASSNLGSEDNDYGDL